MFIRLFISFGYQINVQYNFTFNKIMNPLSLNNLLSLTKITSIIKKFKFKFTIEL